MAKLITLQANKTYATAANAVKAVEKLYPAAAQDGLTYLMMTTPEGRYFPVFLGERALNAMVQFHFHVAG